MAVTEQEIQSIKLRFGIMGNSPLLNNAVRVAMQVAPTDMSVLITGESGSGKESFSKIIHSLSPRKHGQFIAINCGSIPEGTIDSELFGHEKGSFTGAHESRKGYFEVTNGGTIFLDEIGEMPLGTQARLLRVLENGEFIKVGSSKVLKTDVRVVAATNVNLLEQVEVRKFRQDLYYRLNTVPVYIPALRERGNDVELLFRKFASDFSEKYKVKPIVLSDDAKKILSGYRFPGNIRQLKNLIEQMSVLSTENKLIDSAALQSFLPKESSLPALYRHAEGESVSERELLYKILFELRKDVNELKMSVLKEGGISRKEEDMLGKLKPPSLEEDAHFINIKDAREHPTEDIQYITPEEDSLSIQKTEKELIRKALEKNRNRRKYAALDLGISERTLYRKIKEYDLDK
ncbi:MAG: sigma-54-dependent Fis family transcriptional regulator [Candidatus Nephrothrix sp. EaCA]|nr:MAG: sigma-54-dependent Fis family transcriptional regulator [Candidatus Nephrothrix sp. EaCA]